MGVPNAMLLQAAKDLDYSYGDDHLVDVLELMMARVDKQQVDLDGRDADHIAELADDFHAASRNCYAAPTALRVLQAEGRLTIAQAARYLNVEPIVLARLAMPSHPEALLEFDDLIWAGELSYRSIALRWNIEPRGVQQYAQSRGMKRRHGERTTPAVHASAIDMRRAGMPLKVIAAKLADAGTPLHISSISKLCKSAGLGRVA